MRRFALRWIISFVSIFVAAELFGLISVSTGSTLVAAVLVLSVLNAILKPVLILITLPINFMTLGLFTVVINTVLLKLTDSIVPGFEVGGFLNALLASVVISILSVLFGQIVDRDRRARIVVHRDR
jgi:putative membrane protein